MKRLSFAIMLALCTMGVWAQEGIKVEFKGASPDIFDFVWDSSMRLPSTATITPRRQWSTL